MAGEGWERERKRECRERERERERESGVRDDTILVLDQVYTLVGVYIGSDLYMQVLQSISLPHAMN